MIANQNNSMSAITASALNILCDELAPVSNRLSH